ncbi:MAG: prepilin-type N-terminal cleavage/methylation domain-containing protein [Bdellovibrionales bacterium]|nr:prepilin-type N-terminal cleavage/methylation domain-containing protein [Bdellovibrionales bacterium]
MTSKAYLLRCDSGFTLTELMVASTIGLIVLGLGIQSTNAMRYLYLHDIVRTRMHQDMRSALDIMGVNIRQAGENFNASFPAIQLIDGGAGSDELVLHRNLIDEVLNVCTDVNSGSGVTNIYFAIAGTEQGCAYSDNLFGFSSWQSFRTAHGGQAQGYILNLGSKLGEFFTYSGETDNGSTELSLQTGSGAWSRDYPAGTSALYVLEKWNFRLVDDVLQLVINDDQDNALNVAFGLTDFQVRAHLQDGSTLDELNISHNWTRLESIEVELRAEDSFAGQTISDTLSSRFFPRNILSN